MQKSVCEIILSSIARQTGVPERGSSIKLGISLPISRQPPSCEGPVVLSNDCQRANATQNGRTRVQTASPFSNHPIKVLEGLSTHSLDCGTTDYDSEPRLARRGSSVYGIETESRIAKEQ